MVDYIRPKDLPAGVGPQPNDLAIPADNGIEVVRVTPAQIVATGRPIATEAQALAGTDNTATMTPLATAQAMDSRLPGIMQPYVDLAQAWAESVTNPDPADITSKSAKTWAGEAAVSAVQAAMYGPLTFPSASAFLASTTVTAAMIGKRAGAQTGGAAWDIVAPGSGDFDHPVTGVGVRVVRLPDGSLSDTAFGVVHDGVTDNATALQRSITAAAGGILRIAAGVALTSAALIIGSGTVVEGAGWGSALKSTGTNADVIYGDGVENVSIRNLRTVGNKTGAGGSAGVGGNGIKITNAKNINIEDCFFSGIGLPSGSTYATCITVTGESVRVVGNHFDADCRSATGADINLGTTKNTVVSGNISDSEHDAFISLSSVSNEADGSDVIRHSITGNIAVRRGEAARSAIIVVYDGKPGRTAVTGNVLEGFIWCGVYISAAAGSTTSIGAGGVTVQGNIVRYCAGAGTITSDIYVAGTGGTTVTGNLSEFSGYRRDGSVRGTSHAGIGVFQYTRGVTITGNMVRYCAGAGIALTTLAGDIVSGTVTGNTVQNHAGPGIRLASQFAGAVIRNVIVALNVTDTDTDARGISIEQSSGGTFDGLAIVGNRCRIGASGTTASGIFSTGHFAGRIEGNSMDGFNIGLQLQGGTARSVPDQLLVRGNSYRNCATARSLSSNASRQISLDDHFVSCASLGSNSDLSGAQIGTNAAGLMLVEISATAAPTAGPWLAGDRCLNLSAAASGYIGWVCTAAGTPGTWKTYGAITA